jgi:L-iditol 2-dehydrogenase
MRAAVFYGANNIANEDAYSNYRVKDKGVVLDVNACAICGYDVRVFRHGHRKVTPPIILGHEICATTKEDISIQTPMGTTSDIPSSIIIRAGSRVAVSPIIPCLNCIYCKNKEYNLCTNFKEIGSNINGGFAEYIKIPENILNVGGLVPVPDNLSDEEAALLEPFACCLNGFFHIMGSPVTKLTGNNNTVAIIGDGPIGLIHLQISKRLYGARTILVGMIPKRMTLAKAMGADATLSFDDKNNTNGGYPNHHDDSYNEDQTLRNILDLTDGIGANIIIIATSNPRALNFAIKIASKNSRINIFSGMPRDNNILLDANWLHYNQTSITGSFSSTPYMLQEAAQIASSGKIDLSKIISHQYSLAEIKDAIIATEKYYGLRVVINKF